MKRSAENDGESDGSEAMMPPLASGDESSQEYNADIHLTDDQSTVDTASEYDADFNDLLWKMSSIRERKGAWLHCFGEWPFCRGISQQLRY